jgi:hypothetical protein
MTGTLRVVCRRVACLTACSFIDYLPIYCHLKYMYTNGFTMSWNPSECKYIRQQRNTQTEIIVSTLNHQNTRKSFLLLYMCRFMLS